MDAQNINEINTFEDIIFKPHSDRDNAVMSRVDVGDAILSVVGGESLYGDGETTFEVAFIEKGKDKLTTLDKVLKENTKGLEEVFGKYSNEINRGDEVLAYANKKDVMSIINSKQLPMIITLEEISKNLVDSAMKSGEDRLNGLEKSKELLENADEDIISKNEKEIIEVILIDLIKQEKGIKKQTKKVKTEKAKTTKAKSVDVEDINIESVEDICALNTLLDDVIEVDDVAELNELLDCELGKL